MRVFQAVNFDNWIIRYISIGFETLAKYSIILIIYLMENFFVSSKLYNGVKKGDTLWKFLLN